MIDTLITIAAALTSGLVMYLFGYRKANKVDRDRRAAKRLEDVKKAQEVRDEVEVLDDAGLADRASKWLRADD